MGHKQYAVDIPDSFNPNSEPVNIGYFNTCPKAVR